MATALIGVNDMTALGILSELAAQVAYRVIFRCVASTTFFLPASPPRASPPLTIIFAPAARAAVDMVITQRKHAFAHPSLRE